MKRKLINEIDRSMVIAQINRLDLKKLYTVEIIHKSATRTISQNSLYWLWLTCIESETGNERSDLHDYYKKRYIMPAEVVTFGETSLKYTTTALDTSQFRQYLDKIQIFASTELSITLPNPEDRLWDEFYNYYVDK